MSESRRILLVVHPARPEVHDHALGVVKRLTAAGVAVAVISSEMRGTPLEGVTLDAARVVLLSGVRAGERVVTAGAGLLSQVR